LYGFILLHSDSSGAAAIINSWVADNTSKMIRDIIPPGAVNSQTRLVLVNAIYFKGDWANKFDKADTKTEDFFVSPTETIKVELMHKHKAKFNYGTNQDLNCQALELSYSGDALSMFVVLPDKVTNLAAVESKLTAAILLDIEESFRMSKRGEVHIWIPKFRLDEGLELSSTLQSMGMADAFSAADADFTGMDGGKNLFISKV